MTSPVSAIEAIEKAMEGVTPGPWKAEGYVVMGDWHASGGIASVRSGARAFNDADYIAACNPVAMREVLALARKAEALQRENADKDARIAALTKGLTPFARIADMTRDNATGASVMVNVDRCRDASALLGGSDAE